MQNVNQTTEFKPLPGILLTLLSTVLLFSCSRNIAESPRQEEVSASNQSSQTQTEHSEVVEAYESTLFISCANAGAGEDVALTGTIKLVTQVTYNDHRFTMTYHVIPQGVTGVGLLTGDNFIATGGNRGTVTGSIEYAQYTATDIAQMRITGQGVNFSVNYKFHITINPDGKISTRISDEKIDCNN